ncbi:MAG: hypothetical protein K8T91_03865 [Planctomycetes bacterium]|nr:hypothetical protein [Planctomycetota bacterium]
MKSFWRALPSLKRIAIVASTIAFVAWVVIEITRPYFESWRERRDIQNRINGYSQSAVAPLKLPSKLTAQDAQFSGKSFRKESRHYNLDLVFEPATTKSGDYHVKFLARPNKDAYTAERMADYRNGIVVLERAFPDPGDAVYARLYCIRVRDRIVLVPEVMSRDVKALLSAIDEADTQGNWHLLQRFAYVEQGTPSETSK